MSIYATLWELKWPRDGAWASSDDDYVEVWCQAVPAHIGHPSDYPEGDPYADFLPPPVRLDEVEEPYGPPYRAVFICGPLTTKGTTRSGQEYVDPLIVLTGDEYESITWPALHERIGEALRRQLGEPRTTAIFIAPDGTTRRFTEDNLPI
ncbi:MAG: hypothetical protein HYX51_08005 [Chloroflexi bacterium]|nr:hypothetical protein [Chloroflexota bacterium]